MISKRGLVAAGALGLGSVVLATTSAFACSINDFKATVSCDANSGQGQVTVTDHDGSDTPATVTVAEQGSNDTIGGPQTLTPDHGTGSVTFTVPWKSGATYTVHVQTLPGSRYTVNDNTTAQAPESTCGTPSTPPSQPVTPPASTAPSTPPAQPVSDDSPSAAPSTPAAAPTQSSSTAPTPSAAQSSPGTVLAETGGGSNTGPMIGIAAALVVIGGAAVVINRRRAARHN